MTRLGYTVDPACRDLFGQIVGPDSGRSLRPGSGPHTAQEICMGCGRWLRWVPKMEAEARFLEECPF